MNRVLRSTDPKFVVRVPAHTGNFTGPDTAGDHIAGVGNMVATGMTPMKLENFKVGRWQQQYQAVPLAHGSQNRFMFRKIFAPNSHI
jgi:hypothetical protein